MHELKHSVSQGRSTIQIFFSIHIFNLINFLNMWEIANYADEATPYTIYLAIPTLYLNLILFKWLDDSCMKINSDESYLLLS